MFMEVVTRIGNSTFNPQLFKTCLFGLLRLVDCPLIFLGSKHSILEKCVVVSYHYHYYGQALACMYRYTT